MSIPNTHLSHGWVTLPHGLPSELLGQVRLHGFRWVDLSMAPVKFILYPFMMVGVEAFRRSHPLSLSKRKAFLKGVLSRLPKRLRTYLPSRMMSVSPGLSLLEDTPETSTASHGFQDSSHLRRGIHNTCCVRRDGRVREGLGLRSAAGL